MGSLLDAIAARTGTRIHYSSLPPDPVTLTCKGESLKQVMGCILGPEADLMYRYSGDSTNATPPPRPVELWVLESSFGPAPSPTGSESSTTRELAQTRENPAMERPANTPPEDSMHPKKEDIGKLLGWAGGQDPALRAKAVALLAADEESDGPTVMSALRTALSDEDAEVRAQAVYGMVQRGGAEAPAVLRAALNDGDADVRLMAVDGAGTDAEGLEVLRKALTDRDSTVRALATLRLEPLANPNPQNR